MWTAVPSLLFAGVIVASGVIGARNAADGQPSFNATYMGGYFIGGIAIAMLLAWASFKVAKRSNTIAAVAFTAVLALCTIGSVAGTMLDRAGSRTGVVAALEKRDAANTKTNDRLLRELDEHGTIAPDPSRMDEARQALAEAARNATGDNKVAIQASLELAEYQQTTVNRYTDAMKAFINAGALEPSTLSSQEAIRNRMQLLHKVETTSKALELAVKESSEVFERQLISNGISAANAAKFKETYEKNIKLQKQMRIREADAVFCHAARTQLELLLAEWGKWTYKTGPEKGMHFEKKSSLEKYKQTIATVNKAAQSQRDAQRDLLTTD